MKHSPVYFSDDFRLFAGDLGNEVTDEVLARAFSKYPSYVKAKVVRDKRTNKTKGYGFVSFRDPNDFVKAMREVNGKSAGYLNRSFVICGINNFKICCVMLKRV